MRYSLVRVTSAGVVLCDYHARRFAPYGEHARAAFLRFAAAAAPGIWAVSVDEGGALRTEARSRTRLFDDMPVRWRCSPVLDRTGRFPKPSSPSPYDAVRREGVATLLTSANGREVFEACSAAVLGWDGDRWVCPPADRPRVWSTAEQAVREHMSASEAPLAVVAPLPLLLVNAVKGACTIAAPDRDPLPPRAVAEIEHLFAALTLRPSR